MSDITISELHEYMLKRSQQCADAIMECRNKAIEAKNANCNGLADYWLNLENITVSRRNLYDELIQVIETGEFPR